MNKYLYKFVNVSPSHRLDLFDKLIQPILNYGSEVLGFVNGNAVEKIHMQFCKTILGIKKTTQNDFVYGELGRVSCRTQRLYNTIKYWAKILTSNDNKYVKRIYNLLKDDLELMPNKINWCSLLRDLLSSLGLYEVWFSQTIGNTDIFLALVKQRLNDHFVQNWSERLNNSSRALFYRSIAEFKFQSYLKVIQIDKYRNVLTRLRVSSHKLCIETGRWVRNRLELDQRKCLRCNILEDEYHFVLEIITYLNIIENVPICISL